MSAKKSTRSVKRSQHRSSLLAELPDFGVYKINPIRPGDTMYDVFMLEAGEVKCAPWNLGATVRKLHGVGEFCLLEQPEAQCGEAISYYYVKVTVSSQPVVQRIFADLSHFKELAVAAWAKNSTIELVAGFEKWSSPVMMGFERRIKRSAQDTNQP